MSLKHFTLALLVAVATPTVVAASPQDGAEVTEASQLSESDLTVLGHRHRVNLREIEMGKLAQRHGTREVRSYGAMLIKAHRRADLAVQQVAEDHDATLSSDPDPQDDAAVQAHQDGLDTMARLGELDGVAFDREFLIVMVNGHTTEITRIDAALIHVAAGDVKELLEKARPVVQEHADKARGLLKARAPATASR